VANLHLSRISSIILTLVYYCYDNVQWFVVTLVYFILGVSVHVQTAEPSDFENVERISFLAVDFVVDEEHFNTFPENSLVVLDDFSFKVSNIKLAKLNFFKVNNYVLRHKKITLVLIIHNLFNNNLFNEILYSSQHLFLSYSNLGYMIMRYKWGTYIGFLNIT